jgi:hypothetical protein
VFGRMRPLKKTAPPPSARRAVDSGGADGNELGASKVAISEVEPRRASGRRERTRGLPSSERTADCSLLKGRSLSLRGRAPTGV